MLTGRFIWMFPYQVYMKVDALVEELNDSKALERQLLENPELLRNTINKNPALLEYIFSDAKIRRKYVKILPKTEQELRQLARETGIAEGILLGLGVALLLLLIFGRK